MLEKIKDIGEKIAGIIGTLIFVLVMSMVGFGIVVGLFAIAYYCPCGPLVALFVLYVLYVLIRRFISKGLSIGFIIVMTPFVLIIGFELLFYYCGDILITILAFLAFLAVLSLISETVRSLVESPKNQRKSR